MHVLFVTDANAGMCEAASDPPARTPNSHPHAPMKLDRVRWTAAEVKELIHRSQAKPLME